MTGSPEYPGKSNHSISRRFLVEAAGNIRQTGGSQPFRIAGRASFKKKRLLRPSISHRICFTPFVIVPSEMSIKKGIAHHQKWRYIVIF
jgi:hypothetical protein